MHARETAQCRHGEMRDYTSELPSGRRTTAGLSGMTNASATVSTAAMARTGLATRRARVCNSRQLLGDLLVLTLLQEVGHTFHQKRAHRFGLFRLIELNDSESWFGEAQQTLRVSDKKSWKTIQLLPKIASAMLS